jgi:hypothetical protein
LDQLEKARLEQLEKERLDQLEKARLDQLEKERLDQLEKARLEQLEKERLDQLEKARRDQLEKERLNQLEKTRMEQQEKGQKEQRKTSCTDEGESNEVECAEQTCADEYKRSEQIRIQERQEKGHDESTSVKGKLKSVVQKPLTDTRVVIAKASETVSQTEDAACIDLETPLDFDVVPSPKRPRISASPSSSSSYMRDDRYRGVSTSPSGRNSPLRSRHLPARRDGIRTVGRQSERGNRSFGPPRRQRQGNEDQRGGRNAQRLFSPPQLLISQDRIRELLDIEQRYRRNQAGTEDQNRRRR